MRGDKEKMNLLNDMRSQGGLVENRAENLTKKFAKCLGNFGWARESDAVMHNICYWITDGFLKE